MQLRCRRMTGDAQADIGDDNGTPPSTPWLPSAAVLRRHGARVLEPGDGASAPTVYRAGVLLSTEPAAEQPDTLEHCNRTLAATGMRLAAHSDHDHDGPGDRHGDGGHGDPDHGGQGPDGPVRERAVRRRVRAVQLVAAHGGDPESVDAWAALKALRAGGHGAHLSLDHLLFGASIGGVPRTEGLSHDRGFPR